jgi:hypothetical protein
LAETIGALTGSVVEIRHVKPRAGEIRHSVCNPARARQMCDFISRISLDSGLEDLFAS